MRRILEATGFVFSLLLAITGISVLFSIPGVAALIGGLLAAMIGLGSCGVAFAWLLNLIVGQICSINYSGQIQQGTADMMAA